MNFTEWYKKQPPLVDPEKQIARIAWAACKQEVLKILDKHKHPIVDTQLQRDMEIFIDLDAVGEIEKL
jgi:hypothetical protein